MLVWSAVVSNLKERVRNVYAPRAPFVLLCPTGSVGYPKSHCCGILLLLLMGLPME